jgi:tetratricopeptide (TPR) repeat protein
MYEKALNLYKNEFYSSCEILLEFELQTNQSINSLILYGNCLSKQNQHQKAIKSYEKAIKLYNLKPLDQLIKSLLKVGNYTKAKYYLMMLKDKKLLHWKWLAETSEYFGEIKRVIECHLEIIKMDSYCIESIIKLFDYGVNLNEIKSILSYMSYNDDNNTSTINNIGNTIDAIDTSDSIDTSDGRGNSMRVTIENSIDTKKDSIDTIGNKIDGITRNKTIDGTIGNSIGIITNDTLIELYESLYYANTNYKIAIQKFTLLESKYKGNCFLLKNIADLHANSENMNQAINIYKRIKRLDVDYLYCDNYAFILSETRNYSLLSRLSLDLSNICKDYYTCFIILALLDEMKQDHQNALLYIEKVPFCLISRLFLLLIITLYTRLKAKYSTAWVIMVKLQNHTEMLTN